MSGRQRKSNPPVVGPSGQAADGRQGGRDSTSTAPKIDFDPKKVFTVQAQEGKSGDSKEISYTGCEQIGFGSFGIVFKAKLMDTGTVVAVKRVLQDKRFKNRELQIMRMVAHPNIVNLKLFYYSNGETEKDKDEVYLNLILEFIPDTIFRVCKKYVKAKQYMPLFEVKLYMYQLFRSLAYIHSVGICHRDIKPHNLLVNEGTGVLKLCDFGSAKILVPGEQNVSYICSRYYRAPELIFGASNYTTTIDIWSTGCVLAELLLGKPVFPGESGVDQLVEIIKILGTPAESQIREMNPNYKDYKFPTIKAVEWTKLFSRASAPDGTSYEQVSSDAIDLLAKCLEYRPSSRCSPMEALAHPFFNQLRDPNARLTKGGDMPPLFNFSEKEFELRPDLNRALIPPHAEADLISKGIDLSRVFSSAPGSSAPAASSSSNGTAPPPVTTTAPSENRNPTL